MPNWCSNSVRLNFKNASKKMKKRFAALKEAVMLGNDSPEIMGTLYPMPEELSGGKASPGRQGIEQMSPSEQAEYARLIAQYGAADWYEWANKHWGTKWEFQEVGVSVGDVDIAGVGDIDEHTLCFYAESAWGPPIAFYRELFENGVEVEAYFTETGMDFAGVFSNGDVEDFTDLMTDRDQFDNFPKLAEMLEDAWESYDEYEREQADESEGEP
jgi:hypothetical protein